MSPWSTFNAKNIREEKSLVCLDGLSWKKLSDHNLSSLRINSCSPNISTIPNCRENSQLLSYPWMGYITCWMLTKILEKRLKEVLHFQFVEGMSSGVARDPS